MSHYFALVIVPKDTTNVEVAVSKAMAPFNENLKISGFRLVACDCIGHIAIRSAEEKANGIVGDLDTLRAEFDKMHPTPGPEFANLWGKAIAPWVKLEKKFEKTHPLYKKPDPKCGDCSGTGKMKTTRNPKGYWDWYQIGGRWSGVLDGYDPETNPLNTEECGHCRGTKLNNGSETPCAYCEGKGVTPKWPTSWVPYKGDIAIVGDIKERRIPYTIVSDDKWLSKEKWNGKSFATTKDFTKKATKILDDNKENIAVVVDYHS